MRLKAIGREMHWDEVWAIYSGIFSRVITADESIAHQAVLLCSTTPEHLPTIDGLIAATALIEA